MTETAGAPAPLRDPIRLLDRIEKQAAAARAALADEHEENFNTAVVAIAFAADSLLQLIKDW